MNVHHSFFVHRSGVFDPSFKKVFSIHVEKIQDWIQHCIVEAVYTQDPKQQTI